MNEIYHPSARQIMPLPIVRFERKVLDRPEQQVPAPWKIVPWRGVQDVVQWLQLQNRAYGRDKRGRLWSEADFNREFRRDAAPAIWFALAPQNDRPVGTVALRFQPDRGTAIVHWLAVDPDWQRRGIGRALVQFVEREARQHGCWKIEAETHAQWTAAVQLYRACRFTTVGKA